MLPYFLRTARSLILCASLAALEPVALAAQAANPSYPDTAAGLKSFLQKLSERVASEDSAKASLAFKQLKIPDAGVFTLNR
jgi:hypothetical protein